MIIALRHRPVFRSNLGRNHSRGQTLHDPDAGALLLFGSAGACAALLQAILTQKRLYIPLPRTILTEKCMHLDVSEILKTVCQPPCAGEALCSRSALREYLAAVPWLPI